MTQNATDEPIGRLPLYDIDNLPEDFEAPGGNAWATFQKRVPTEAIRIEGPFKVITSHGGDPVHCEDGWLALDAQHYPYPITDGEFRESYMPAGPLPVEDPKPSIGELFERLAEYVEKQQVGTLGFGLSREWSVSVMFGEEEPGSSMVAGAAHGIGDLHGAIENAARECGLL